MKKKKQKTYAQLKVVLDNVYSICRRLEGADSNGYVQCVSCGIQRHWKDRMTAGHYISRTKTKIRWDDRNVWPQCTTCNWKQKLTGDCTEYTIWLVENLGYSAIQDLNEIKDCKVKLTRPDLEEMIERYKRKTRELGQVV